MRLKFMEQNTGKKLKTKKQPTYKYHKNVLQILHAYFFVSEDIGQLFAITLPLLLFLSYGSLLTVKDNHF